MESVSLEPAGIYPRMGFDCWRADGSFAFRTRMIGRVFGRRATFFRVNATGKIYRVVSRWKTVEVAAQFDKNRVPPPAVVNSGYFAKDAG